MKKLLVAALAVLIASPAFAAVQNVKVSGDIQSMFIDRQTFDLGARNAQGIQQGLFKQNVFAEQTRVRIDADLTDNVSTTVRLINESAWGTDASDASNKAVDLDLAYVTLREFLYSPLTVSIGRQEFIFGNGLIMGGGANNSTSGHFNGVANDLSKIDAQDGIKAVLDYKPLTISMFYIKNSQTIFQGALDSGVKSSSDVYGVNGNYQLGDAMNTVLESYLFARFNQTLTGGSTTTICTGGVCPDKGDKLYIPGLRVSTNPVKGLNVQGELAWQLGQKTVGTTTQESEHRNAMAAQFMASYALPVLEKYKPTVNASYTKVTGDKNRFANYGSDAVKSAKVYTAWDPMFENQGGGTIYNTLFNLTDMNILSVGASVNPIQDVTTSLTWSNLSLDKKIRLGNTVAFLQPDGSSAGALVPTGRKDIGNELDLNGNYAYTEDVNFGVSLGWFVPGGTFTSANNSVAKQALAYVDVNF
ncbi:MAG: alginate export family protein [Candidatus Omnitrophica bacterium]|nr:alginate export family protein [Candidatus Omnitrophota bacterium]